MAFTTLQMPLPERSCDERSVEDGNSAGSELDEELSQEQFGAGGKCRRAGGRKSAPKPYAKPNWTEREDACLRSIVAAKLPEADSSRKWTVIAKEKNSLMRPIREAKQCRDRWNDHLNPQLNKGDWTRAEFDSLVAEHKLHFAISTMVPWAAMAKSMGTSRSSNDLKNKFNACARRQISMAKRNKSFSADELAGPAAALIAYVTELNAAKGPADSETQQPRRQCRRTRAVSEDSDSGYNSDVSAPPPPPPPRAQRPRRQQWRAAAEPAPQADHLGMEVLEPFWGPEPVAAVLLGSMPAEPAAGLDFADFDRLMDNPELERLFEEGGLDLRW